MDNDEVRKRYEDMWERRKRIMHEIARKERRREQDAIFRILKDREGDGDE